MKKAKALSLITVPALAVGMLAACGPKEDNKKASDDKKADNKTLVVWEDKDKVDGIKEAVAKFEKENNIKVKVKEMNVTDQLKQLRLDGPAGTGADVITLPHDQIGGAVTEGLLSEMTADTAAFSEVAVNAETFKGKLYGLPKAIETPVFIYNKKLMPQAPKTMDELYTSSKAATKDGKYGFLALGDNFYFANGFLAGMGGFVFGGDAKNLDATKLGLNNDGAVKGAEYLAKWYKEGLFPTGIIGEKGASALDGLFTEGKATSVMNGPWAFKNYKKANVDFGVAAMPTLPNGEHVKTFLGVKGYHVSSYSKKKDLANKFVAFITNEENSKVRYAKTQEIPPVKAIMPTLTDEGAKAVAEQSQYATPMPNIPEMGEVWAPAASALQNIATGKSDAKKALDEAVNQISTNIKTNHSKK